MIVVLEIDERTRRSVRAAAERAEGLGHALGEARLEAGWTLAEGIRQRLIGGDLGIQARHPGTGLAASLSAWPNDPGAAETFVGVPSNSPAAAYARIHESGGDVLPRSARALAIPLTPEAETMHSPRQMAGLAFIPRRGATPSGHRLVGLLADRVRGRLRPQWALVSGVTLPATHWFSRGAEEATPEATRAFADHLNRYLERAR